MLLMDVPKKAIELDLSYFREVRGEAVDSFIRPLNRSENRTVACSLIKLYLYVWIWIYLFHVILLSYSRV